MSAKKNFKRINENFFLRLSGGCQKREKFSGVENTDNEIPKKMKTGKSFSLSLSLSLSLPLIEENESESEDSKHRSRAALKMFQSEIGLTF